MLIPVTWLCADVLGIGVGFSLDYLPESIYVNFCLFGMVGILFTFCATFLVDKIDRKCGLFLAWGFLAFGCILFQFTSQYSVLAYALLPFIRFAWQVPSPSATC